MKHKFTVEGLDCPVCASKLATRMAELEGVNNVKINFLSEKLTVDSELEVSELLPMLQKTAKAFDPDVKVK
jgi:copper chaperone CopZ